MSNKDKIKNKMFDTMHFLVYNKCKMTNLLYNIYIQ